MRTSLVKEAVGRFLKSCAAANIEPMKDHLLDSVWFTEILSHLILLMGFVTGMLDEPEGAYLVTCPEFVEAVYTHAMGAFVAALESNGFRRVIHDIAAPTPTQAMTPVPQAATVTPIQVHAPHPPTPPAPAGGAGPSGTHQAGDINETALIQMAHGTRSATHCTVCGIGGQGCPGGVCKTKAKGDKDINRISFASYSVPRPYAGIGNRNHVQFFHSTATSANAFKGWLAVVVDINRIKDRVAYAAAIEKLTISEADKATIFATLGLARTRGAVGFVQPEGARE